MVGDNPYSVQFKVDIPKYQSGKSEFAGNKIRVIKIAPADTQVTSDVQNGLAQAYGAISNISLAVLRGKVNPARYDSENALEILAKEFKIAKKQIQGWLNYYSGDINSTLNRVFREYDLTNKAQKKGYDGIIYNNGIEYVAFSPNQIKSVDNRGTFDPENPNIYLQEIITDNKPVLKERESGPKIADDSETVEVVKIPENSIPDFKTKKELVQFIMNIVGNEKNIIIKSTGDVVFVSKTAVNRVASKTRSKKYNEAFSSVKKLLENAKYSGFIEADERHKNVLGQDVYHSALIIGDKPYSVQFKVDIPLETGTHNYAGHKITDIKIAPSDSAVELFSSPMQNKDAISNVSLAVLRGKVNPARYDAENNRLYQKAYVSMKGELVGDYLDADEFEGTGEGAFAHGWGNYLLKDRKTNKVRYFDRWNERKIFYQGKEVGFKGMEALMAYYLDKQQDDGLSNNEIIALVNKDMQRYKGYIKEEMEKMKKDEAEYSLDKNLLEDIKEYAKNDGNVRYEIRERIYNNLTNRAIYTDWYRSYKNYLMFTKYLEEFKKMKNLDFSKVEIKNSAAQYEAEVPEDEFLLDEDLPLNKQSDYVQEKLKDVFNELKFPKKKEVIFNDPKTAKETYDIQMNLYQRNGYGYERLSPEIDDLPDGRIVVRFVENFNFYQTDEYTWKMSGRDAYDSLTRYLKSQKRASKLLEKHGIKGIKYDGRTDGIGYVIFKGADAPITRRLLQRAYSGEFSQLRDLPKKKKTIKGEFSVLEKSIDFTKDADFSTLPHEFAHFWLDNIWNYVESGLASQEYLEQFNEVRKFLGLKKGEYPTPKQHEKFARAYEKYLYKGEVPNSVIGTVFSHYENFIRDVYNDITEIDTMAGLKSYQPISKGMYDFFNSMVSGNLPKPATFVEDEEDERKEIDKNERETIDYVKEESKAIKERREIVEEMENASGATSNISMPVQTDARKGFLSAYKKMTGQEVEVGGANLQQELEKTTKFVMENPELAKKIVRGEEPAPLGYVKNVIYIAYDNVQRSLGNTSERGEALLNQAFELMSAGQNISSQRLAYGGPNATYFISLLVNNRFQNVADRNKMTKKEIAQLVSKEVKEGLSNGKTPDEIVEKLSRDLNVDKLQQAEVTVKPANNTKVYPYRATYKYVNEKLGLGAKLSEIEYIIRKADDMYASLENSKSDNGNPTVDYFIKLKDMEDYINTLCPSSNLRVAISVCGPGALLTNVKTPVTNFVSTFFTHIFKHATRRISLGQSTSIVDTKLIEQAKNESMLVFHKTGYNIFSKHVEKGRRILGEETTHTSGEGAIRFMGRLYEKIAFKASLGYADTWFKNKAFTDYASLMATKMSNGDTQKANDLFLDACRIEPLTEDGANIRNDAIDESLITTYQNDGILSKIALDVRRAFDLKIGFGHIFEPFAKTPANIIGFGANLSLGTFRAIGSEVIRDIQAGRFLTPSSKNVRIMVENGLGVLLALAISAGIDDEDYMPAYSLATNKDKQLSKELNIPYNSIKIDGVWVSLDYLGPLASPLVAVLQARKEEGLLKGAYGYVKGATLQALTLPQFGLIKSISDTLENMARKEPEKFIDETFENIVEGAYNRIVPMIVSDIANAIDPYEREKSGFEIQQKVPVLREQLPVKINKTSGVAEKTGNFALDIFVGSRAKVQVSNVVADEFKRLSDAGHGVNLTDATRNGKLSKVDESIKPMIERDFAERYSQEVSDLIYSSDYEYMEDAEKLKSINKIRTKIIKELKEEYLEKE